MTQHHLVKKVALRYLQSNSREEYRTKARAEGRSPYEGRPRRTWRYKDYTLEFYPSDYNDGEGKIFGRIAAVDPEGRVVGDLFFGLQDGDLLGSVEVSPDHRRKGIATAMYDAGEDIAGRKFVPDPSGHSSDAAAFWKNRSRRSKKKI